jgi:ribonuclease-3 family protein
MDMEEINKISNLGLAHIGDAVYELMVRSWLCSHGKATSKGLHTATVSYVRAPAQAEAAKKIMPLLTDAELAAYKRGRNTRVNSVPQKSSIEQYHAATGLEALFGWLYLQGKTERLNEIFAKIMED